MISDTLYSKYIAERADAHILEDDKGFIVYRIKGKECFIMDMYVTPECRKSGHARVLVSQLNDIVKESECLHITANIFIDDKGASNTLASALRIGFKIVSANAGVLLIAKEVGR